MTAAAPLPGGDGASHACRPPSQVQLQYLKPVQTGYPRDSDARLVVRRPPGPVEHAVALTIAVSAP